MAAPTPRFGKTELDTIDLRLKELEDRVRKLSYRGPFIEGRDFATQGTPTPQDGQLAIDFTGHPNDLGSATHKPKYGFGGQWHEFAVGDANPYVWSGPGYFDTGVVGNPVEIDNVGDDTIVFQEDGHRTSDPSFWTQTASGTGYSLVAAEAGTFMYMHTITIDVEVGESIEFNTWINVVGGASSDNHASDGFFSAFGWPQYPSKTFTGPYHGVVSSVGFAVADIAGTEFSMSITVNAITGVIEIEDPELSIFYLTGFTPHGEG